MRRLAVAALVPGILLALVPQNAFSKAQLPSKDFIQKQVAAAGFDYDSLVSPKTVFPKCKIRIYTFFNSLWLETWKAMAEEYRKFQPNVEIQFVQGPGNYEEKLYTMIVANVQPEIVMSEVGNVPYFLNTGLMIPLNSYIKADKWNKVVDKTFPTIVDRFSDDGKLYGMATDTAPQACVYYNKTLLSSAGLPPPRDNWTLDDAVVYGQKLTQPSKKQWGFWPGDYRSIVYTFGGRLVDSYKKPTKWVYDSPKARAGFEWFQSLWTKQKVCLDPTKMDGSGMFASGKLAMYINGIWDSEALSKAKKTWDWDVAMHPRLNAGSPAVVRTGGTSLCVVKNTKNQNVSWDVIKFLTGPIGQICTSQAGYAQPALEPLFWTETWAKNERIKPINKSILAEATRNVVYEPDIAVWRQIEAVINEQLNKVWTGRQSIDQAISTSLPKAQKMMDEATGRRNVLRKK